MFPRLEHKAEGFRAIDEESGQEVFYIYNKKGEEFQVQERLYSILMEADGLHPLPLPKHLIYTLEKDGIITTRRFIHCGKYNCLRLWRLAGRFQGGVPFCQWMNRVLPILSVVLYVLGCLALPRTSISSDSFYMLPYTLILIASVILHECGHLMAGLAYGVPLHECGILFAWYLPTGAYISHGEDTRLTSRQRIQFSLAGLEANLCVAGICAILSAVTGSGWSFTFLGIWWIETLVCLLNLLPLEGVDGESALSAYLEVDSIEELATYWLSDPERKQMMLASGPDGQKSCRLFAFVQASKWLVWVVGVLMLVIFFLLCFL